MCALNCRCYDYSLLFLFQFYPFPNKFLLIQLGDPLNVFQESFLQMVKKPKNRNIQEIIYILAPTSIFDKKNPRSLLVANLQVEKLTA